MAMPVGGHRGELRIHLSLPGPAHGVEHLRRDRAMAATTLRYAVHWSRPSSSLPTEQDPVNSMLLSHSQKNWLVEQTLLHGVP